MEKVWKDTRETKETDTTGCVQRPKWLDQADFSLSVLFLYHLNFELCECD